MTEPIPLWFYSWFEFRFFFFLALFLGNTGPKFSVGKKGVRKKRNTQTQKLRQNNSSRFYSLGLQLVAARKVCFIAFFLPPLHGGDGVCHGSRLVDTFLSVVSWQAGYDVDRGVRDTKPTCLETCLELPKISWLDFLWTDLKDQIKDYKMFSDTSENESETRESSCVIILKPRLNSAGHSTRTH